MKVILIKDVARLGRKGEVKEVPDGHAINFLIPRKLAVIGTGAGLRRAEEEGKKHEEHHEKLREAFSHSCALLNDKVVRYATEANEQGHLFKGVGVRDITKHLIETEGIILAETVMKLEHPIKSIGIHTIPLSYDGLSGTCTLEIVKK